jgi:hypothetical protein
MTSDRDNGEERAYDLEERTLEFARRSVKFCNEHEMLLGESVELMKIFGSILTKSQ